MSISRDDLEKLLEKFPVVDILESYKDKPLKGTKNTYDSTQIYLNKHKTQALWLLKNTDLILKVIKEYSNLRQYSKDEAVIKEYPILGTATWIRGGKVVKRDGKGGWVNE